MPLLATRRRGSVSLEPYRSDSQIDFLAVRTQPDADLALLDHSTSIFALLLPLTPRNIVPEQPQAVSSFSRSQVSTSPPSNDFSFFSLFSQRDVTYLLAPVAKNNADDLAQRD